MKKLLIIILAIAAYQLAKAQDYKQDLLQMQEKINGINKLHAVAEVKMYMTEKASKPVTVKRSIIKKDGDNYYCSMENAIVLINRKCMLLVYDDDRQIIYTEQKRNEAKAKQQMSAADISELLKKNDSIAYKGISNGIKHYIAYSSKGMMRSADIFINSSTGFLHKVIYHYNPEMVPQVEKVEIDYHTFNTNPEFGKDDFSEQKFVQRKGKELKGSGNYSGYNILNYDPEKF